MGSPGTSSGSVGSYSSRRPTHYQLVPISPRPSSNLSCNSNLHNFVSRTTRSTMKTALVLLMVVAAVAASTFQLSPNSRSRRAPQRFSQGRSQNTNNRFFFGNNQALNDGAVGLALGGALQYFGNQIFNPCRSSNNKNTNNRIFGGNNALSGIIGGYALASIAHNAQGRPCGR